MREGADSARLVVPVRVPPARPDLATTGRLVIDSASVSPRGGSIDVARQRTGARQRPRARQRDSVGGGEWRRRDVSAREHRPGTPSPPTCRRGLLRAGGDALRRARRRYGASWRSRVREFETSHRRSSSCSAIRSRRTTPTRRSSDARPPPGHTSGCSFPARSCRRRGGAATTFACGSTRSSRCGSTRRACARSRRAIRRRGEPWARCGSCRRRNGSTS